MMMIPRSNSCLLPNEPASSTSQSMPGNYGVMITSTGGHEDVESNNPISNSVVSHASTLLHSLSILKERVRQAQSLVCLFASPPTNDHQHCVVEPASMNMIRIATLVQEIMAVSSSLLLTCQQMSLGPDPGHRNNPTRLHFQDFGDDYRSSISGHPYNHPNENQDGDKDTNLVMIQSQDVGHQTVHKQEQILGHHDMFGSGEHDIEWFDDSNSFANATLSYDTTTTSTTNNSIQQETNAEQLISHVDMIIEIDAADLLAKYTHYCRVCGKGFKRDANLRMHMRAHGDEYKSIAALSNPAKSNDPNNPAMQPSSIDKTARRYSCPQDGCRWNRKHSKFQPLKSMICVKNHYKRSHCPKMYVCKRCSQKQFSVLSDLRTHEKHCGDSKWRCSCGTTFSRKDKLLGHVGLFVGHAPDVVDQGYSLTSRLCHG